MSGHIKRLLLIAAVFVFCICTPAFPAGICAQDERVLLPVPGDDIILYYAYDEEGNRIGRLPAEGWGNYAKLVGADSLFPSGGEFRTLVRAGDLVTVASFPVEDYSLFLQGDYYVTLNKETGILTLFDKYTDPIGQFSTGSRLKGEGLASGEILELSDSFFVKAATYDTTVWIRIKKADHAVQEITDPDFLRNLNTEGMTVYSFGDYLMTAPYPYAASKGTRGVVMTEEGTVVIDGVENALEESHDQIYTNRLYYGHGMSESTAQFAVRDAGSDYEIYDASLTCVGTMAKEPERRLRCGSGFVNGLSYPELDGYTCEGFVFDVDAQTLVPYALKADMYLIRKDGKCVEVPASGYPERISSAYYTAIKENGMEVYRIKDGSLMAYYPENTYGCVSLGSEGIRLCDEPEQLWDGTVTIYDNEGNPTYHSKYCGLFAFTNGTWACSRGIYRGLVDMNGNWIFKDITDWRE